MTINEGKNADRPNNHVMGYHPLSREYARVRTSPEVADLKSFKALFDVVYPEVADYKSYCVLYQ